MNRRSLRPFRERGLLSSNTAETTRTATTSSVPALLKPGRFLGTSSKCPPRPKMYLVFKQPIESTTTTLRSSSLLKDLVRTPLTFRNATGNIAGKLICIDVQVEGDGCHFRPNNSLMDSQSKHRSSAVLKTWIIGKAERLHSPIRLFDGRVAPEP